MASTIATQGAPGVSDAVEESATVDTATTQVCQQLLVGLQGNDTNNDTSTSDTAANKARVDANTATFINARFDVSIQSLDQVTRLLATRQKRQGQLVEQLEKAQEATASVIERAEVAARDTIKRVATLEATRHNLLGRVETVTSVGQHPGQLSQQIGQLCNRMQKLQMADEYLRSLLLADDLCVQAQIEAERAPKRALTAFADLAELRRRMSQHGHLSSHLNQLLQSVWLSLHTTLEKRFTRALEEIQWPAPIRYPHSSGLAVKIRTFRRAFADLLVLEEPWAEQLLRDAGIKETSGEDQGQEKTFSLMKSTSTKGQFNIQSGLAIQLMVEPLLVRFKFHFEGKRPTNRLDKPEWMFTHILNVISDHANLLDQECQPLIEHAGLTWRAKQRFITALVQAMSEKLQSDMPRLLDHPALLSHAIAEALSFDVDIRDGYNYRLEDGREWKGTVNVMIGDKRQFKQWLSIEKEFALARYEEIINEDGAWEWLVSDTAHEQLTSLSKHPSYEEATEQDEARPTKSADSLINLMEIVTERYRELPRISDRIRFLLEIQITLLDQYRTEIISKADAYERTRFGALSMVQRQARDQISGLAGLKLLSRWMDSLLYIQSAMRDWADDVFFLELWRDISLHSTPKASPNVDNAWQEATQLGTEGNDEEVTVFEEIIEAYSALVQRLQDLVTRSITQEVTYALKAYTKKHGWLAATHHMLQNADKSSADINETEDNSKPVTPRTPTQDDKSPSMDVQAIEISPELARPLAELAQIIGFLGDNLPRPVTTAILRAVAASIDEWLWMRVVRTHQFGDAGAHQLSVDFERGLASLGRHVIRRPERHYRRMRDIATLYRLPTEKELKPEQYTNTTEDPMTVEQVTQQLRKAVNTGDTSSAQLLLERLCVYSLSMEEAYDAIERRITVHRIDDLF
ncbi:TIP-1 family-domain-containing protein [Syncephalis fuscata]|nr:TIP-1 family-domain-containing protein [Syncephalis fuscata]